VILRSASRRHAIISASAASSAIVDIVDIVDVTSVGAGSVGRCGLDSGLGATCGARGEIADVPGARSGVGG
jgi:hypothetical protein